jgi:hypothetical protein
VQRRDVALAIGLGLLLAGVAIAINEFGPQSPIGWAIEVAYRFWYVGVAAVVLAAVLDWRGLSRSTARVIGFAGLLWVTFLGGMPLLYAAGSALAGPQGP